MYVNVHMNWTYMYGFQKNYLEVLCVTVIVANEILNCFITNNTNVLKFNEVCRFF